MSGTTINPYRFGGQVGYRRDGTNRNYVRERHLNTSKSRWISPDPIGFASGENNLFRYVGNNPITRSDPSGLLGPCHMDPILTFGCCTLPKPECVDITNAYNRSYQQTGALFAKCASCVSAAICAFIIACELADSPCGKLGAPGLSLICSELGPGFQCQNRCMARKWNAKATPKWSRAVAQCKRFGEKSKECCEATVDAEQQGYTQCESECGLTGFLLSLLPEGLREFIGKEGVGCCRPELPPTVPIGPPIMQVQYYPQ